MKSITNQFFVGIFCNVLVLLSLITFPSPSLAKLPEEEQRVKSYLKQLDEIYNKNCRKSAISMFNYETNVTKENEEINTKNAMEFSEVMKQVQTEITEKYPNWKDLKCPRLKSQMRTYFLSGPGNMSTEKMELGLKLSSELTTAFAKTTVCHQKNPKQCNVALEPDLADIMKTSTCFDELAYYWTAWHDAMSKAVPAEKFHQFVQFDNEVARSNGFNHAGEVTADSYNDLTPEWTFEGFKQKMHETWLQVKPHYMKLFAYVRMKLGKFYKGKLDHPEGYMPAHILGNMWAQEWDNTANLTAPFPEIPTLDATEALLKQGYTNKRMFEAADKFFQDMGLYPMNENFWKNTNFEKPTDGRDMVCHPSAYDLCVRNKEGKDGDYRIKMCSEVNQYNFRTIHHEMGHTQYHMHYSHLPYPFRAGANAGFHEAIGDALGLAVTTPKHLQCVLGLEVGPKVDCDAKKASSEATEADLNLLFYEALQKLAFLPFAYSMEAWKWEAFEGKIGPAEYNDRWWQIRKENQGILPPVVRPSGGFDPAAKYHIVADIEYIRYFWSNILVFQFFQSMCIAAGEYNPNDPTTKPLYQCDFSGSKEAGQQLAKMMSMGSSRPWPDALQVMTGVRELSVEPMLNYLKPILDYMDKELQAAQQPACFGVGCGPQKSAVEVITSNNVDS